jgi:predicted unusual protein kinase regulating ubiquinone biosynthesis (AarF/ABC1/UbiB family)
MATFAPRATRPVSFTRAGCGSDHDKTVAQKRSKVPSSRLGRLTHFGKTAGQFAIGGAVERLRRIGSDSADDESSVFLTADNARRLADGLARMRGAALKMGQMLSLESDDFLPPEFARALAPVRNAANGMPLSQIRRVLGQAWGTGWEDRFLDFDYLPMAAASIGEVHRARTTDGRDLALKIQYPGVAKSIDSDVDNMAALLRLAQLLPSELDFSTLLTEAKRQLRQEADYAQEAEYLRAYRDLVADDPRFVVPRVHDDLTTRHVLAMDYVEGVPLESLGEPGVPQATRDRVGALLEHLVFRELFEFRTMQSDPNFANYLWQPGEERIVLLDFGSTVTFDRKMTEGYARIARALIDDDDDAVRYEAERLGYIDPQTQPEYAERALGFIRLICEPLQVEGPFDFGESDLLDRAREWGFDMAVEGMREATLPPPETMFLHRKLVGSYMLNARIGARVDVQALLRPFIQAT